MTSHASSLASTSVCICGDPACAIPFGCCHCGCRKRTPISPVHRKERGCVRGLPIKFCRGHNMRKDSRADHLPPFKLNGRWCRAILLTRGYETIVYASDYERIAALRWRATCQEGYVYAVHYWPDSVTKKPRSVGMHVLIVYPDAMSKPSLKEFSVDHKLGSTLDNRRCNLRKATSAQNSHNTKMHMSRNKSGYKGVLTIQGGRYYAGQIQVKGKNIRVYQGKDVLAAAYAYDEAARKYFGEFACVNFPRRGERGARMIHNAPASPNNESKRRVGCPQYQAGGG